VTEKGVIAAATLFGILIGATAFGDLADRYGRKQMFIVEMVLFAIFITLLTLSRPITSSWSRWSASGSRSAATIPPLT
jgi:MFS family permease